MALCVPLHLRQRTSHASRLNAAGLPLDQIRACLGHSNTTTTLVYIYNPLTPEESLSIMEKAFPTDFTQNSLVTGSNSNQQAQKKPETIDFSRFPAFRRSVR